MKNLLVLPLSLIVFNSSINAASIAVNLSGDTNAARTLGAGESTGVVAQGNWNNLAGAAAAGPVVNLVTTDAVDDSGAATTADFSVSAAPSLVQTGFTPGTPTEQLFNHGIFTTATANSAGLETSVTATQIPYALYDVYVYVGRNHANNAAIDDRVWQFELDGTSIFVGEMDGHGGSSFVEGIGSDFTAADGNYVHFTNVSGSDFTLQANASAGRATLAGIQVVQVPEPNSSALLLLASLMVFGRRVRR